ncbi:IS200/IS605 family transposase [Chryseolinea sp. H1M3-3]|uniref:IS200/IS605 family transposase n=1 Tax=Chryseolinea sp. H1M3-3 TaxID=3034144 RepID=UPI0023EADDC5|nr:IS200/IS605 family transposase [Chryseolinea sp. H1M3-3]
MPYLKVYIHFVWSTKNRIPFLNSPILRQNLWNHIQENGLAKGVFIDTINGYEEHCHCLISLRVDQNISKVMHLLKGESSYWMNKNKLCSQKFEWQDDYFAMSVSESMVDKVRRYIKNQEAHHKTKSFKEEYDELVSKYRFPLATHKNSAHQESRIQ